MKKYFRSMPPPNAWSECMYVSFSHLLPVKTYVPQSETLNSLSAYHSGQGGGATCFISFPEYSTPAKAAEAIIPDPNRHNTNFFIYFSFWLSFSSTLQHVRASPSITKFAPWLDAASLSQAAEDCNSFLTCLQVSIPPRYC